MKTKYFAVLLLPLFLIGTYFFVTHQRGYGAIHYLNHTLNSDYLFQTGDIDYDLLLEPNYSEIIRVEDDITSEFICASTGESAEIIQYYEHTPGYGYVGGWSYRYAVRCRDTYLIVDGSDSHGELVYGPFEKEISSEDFSCFFEDTGYEKGESYFDGCNWHTCQEWGGFSATQLGCERYGKPIYK